MTEGAARPADDRPVPSIRTDRLELVSMTVPFMRALVARDIDAASREIGALVPEGLPDVLEHFLQYRLAQLDADPSIREWLGRVMVLADEHGERRVVGTIGFHGPPDEHGRAEIGYSVQPEYRRRGFARETVEAMFDWASREHGVRRFLASISPANEPSLNLAKGFGFVQIGEQLDDVDGLEYVFEAEWPPRRARAEGGRG